MIVFSLDVDNQNLKLRKYNKEIITTNSVNYFECSINFNGFWNNHDVQKSIIFYQSTKYKYEIALFDNKCVIPSEVLQHPEMPLFIGMVGVNEDPYTILTTNIVCIDLTEGILRSNTQSPEITPTIYDQLLSEFHTMYDDVINKLSGKQDKLTPENAGDNIEITYDGDTVKISASGEISANYEDLNHLPKINNTTIVGDLSLSDIGVPTKTSELTNDSGFITNAVNNLINYYLKSETYTKTEVNNLINAISTMSLQVVEALPIEDIQTNVIYLVPRADSETGNIYDEYIYVSGAWEKIGSTDIDLTGYATETWVNTQIAGFLTQAQIEGLVSTALENYYTKSEVETELANKVDKEPGKGLFSGSYTDLTNKPTIPIVDQTYDGTSANAQSGVAVAQAVTALTGSTAPTTSTVGYVGQHYIDTSTTPNKVYECTAKTAQGTTPETYEYTWTLLAPVQSVSAVGTALVPDANGNVNIPPAGNAPFGQGTDGVITIVNNSGLTTSGINLRGSALWCASTTDNAIKTRQKVGGVVPRILTNDKIDYIVKCAMTDGVGAAWTDTEKNGCYDRITIRKTSLDNVLVSNANYDLGSTEQASVTLTLPTPSGTNNYSCNEIYVAFKSGSTATTLSIVGTYVGDTSYLPSANSICELSFKYVCGTWVLVAKDTALPSI